MAHTPGPWKYARAFENNAPPFYVVVTGKWGAPAIATCAKEDDAKLCAAALEMKAALEFYANQDSWKEVETGIGMQPGEAIDYGATARAALAKAKGQP